MLKLFFSCFVLGVLTPCIGQSITRVSADSLLHLINERRQNKATIFAMLQLSQFYILKSNSNKTDLDSAARLIETSKRMNARIRSRELEGYIYLQESNINKKRGSRIPGKQLALQSVELLKREQNTALLGKAWLALSDFYSYQDAPELRIRISLVENALQCFEKTGNNERQAYCLEVLSDISDTSAADFQRVLKLGKRSLEKYKTVPNANQAGVLISIASLYLDRKEYTTALSYCLMALKNIADIHDSTTLECQINSTTGIIYNELHEYELAASHMEKALAVAERFNDTPSVRLVGLNLTDINISLHRAPRALEIINHVVTTFGRTEAKGQWLRFLAFYLDAYTELHQFEKAQLYCDSMLSIANALSINDSRRLFAYSQAEQFYIYSRQYGKGRLLFGNFKAAIAIARSPGALIKGYDLAFRLDTAEHFYQAAIGELLQKDLIKDSLFTESRNKQVQQLRTEYETYQKEKDIQLLQKEGLLQRQEIRQSKLARNYFIGGLILLLGSLAVVISRYRLKQRSNHQLEVRQKEITSKNNQLEKLLQENEWLLKEVHHRVKNNLQIVMSLLNSQSSYLKDEEAVNAVMQSRNRIQAMSLIHQKLYKTDNVSVINMSDYIRELVDHLKDYASPALHILFNLEIAAVELDVMEAVPVGLILNEAITNSGKYAFQQGHANTITVKLNFSSENELMLYIADNGVGLPKDYDVNQGNSFGMLLIRGMVEDLSGKMEIIHTNGVAYMILFPFVKPPIRKLKIT